MKAELRAALLATSSVAALIFGAQQPADAAACADTNVSPPINNAGSINCITFNNEQGGTANGNFTGATTFTGNVTNSGTITPTGINQNSPAGVAGTDAGISVVGPGVKLIGNITNTGTISGTTAQFAGINIGGGGGGSGAPGSTLQGSIVNAAGGTITGLPGIFVSGVGTVVTGSVTNQTGASITTSPTNGGPGMQVASHASVAGSLVNNGIINTGGTGLLESNATVGGNVSNGGTITIHNGFTAMALVNGGSVGGSVINTGTVTNDNASTNIALWSSGQTIAGGVTNTGTLTGGFGLYISGLTGVVTVGTNISNGGTITAHSSTGLGVHSVSVGGSIINSATINATAAGGIVLGTTNSFAAATVAGNISNSGTINAKTGIAVAAGSLLIGGITNSGNISGSTAAIDLSGAGGANTINQTAGTITGNILLSTHSDIFTQTGGTVAGSIISQFGCGNAIFTLGASSQTFAAGTNITGVGNITVNSGTLELDGTANNDTSTNINGGTLIIGDASHATANLVNAMTVASGILAGYGTITGNVTNTGGMVIPGGSLGTIGTMHVAGNFSQNAGGSTVIEVNPTTAAQLAVSGTAALAGNLNIVYDPGTYTSKIYDIVHAGAVTGTYGTVNGTAPSGTVQTVSYTGTDVDLTLAGGASVETTTAVLGDIASLGLTGFFDADDELFDHLDELGEASDGVKSDLAAAAPMQLAFNGPLQQLAQAGSQLPDMLAQYGGWVRGIGDFQSANNRGATPGYDANGGGFLAGLDRQWGGWTVGLAAGYSGTNVKQNDGSTGDIQTPRVMAYARTMIAPQVVFDAIAGLAYDSIHTSRPVAALGANATESHNAMSENLAVQAGYVMPWQGLTIVPRIGAQYVHLSERGYSETGASGFDLTAPTRHLDSFQPVLSISASEPFTTAGGTRIVPEMKVSYSHELLSVAQTLALTTPAGSLVPATTLTPARDTITLGPQVTVAMNRSLSLYADYKLAIGVGRSLDNIIFAGAKVKF